MKLATVPHCFLLMNLGANLCSGVAEVMQCPGCHGTLFEKVTYYHIPSDVANKPADS